MTAIVYQKNKKTGIVYVYESVSYWDKEKQQSRAKRTCIGKVDPETNDIVPTKKRALANEQITARPGPVPITHTGRSFYGATYLFDRIVEQLGVAVDLKRCFPDTYKQILSIAYYLILEDKNPLSRFGRFAATHKHPYGKAIPSQRSSELFASISEEAKGHFFRLQATRRCEKEFWFYDSTSISSYSKALQQVRYGFNKEHERLEQINLVLLFGQESKVPFYYRKLAGNITDVKTVQKLISDLDVYEFERIKLVMDRGFYSADNINRLYQHHLKFLIAAKTSLTYVQKGIDAVRNDLHTWKNYHSQYGLYATCLPIQWEYSKLRPYKKDTITGTRRMYLHLYYSPAKALEHEQAFNKRLEQLQTELVQGKREAHHEKAYLQYFDVHTTPVRGAKMTAKEDAIARAKQNYGYFTLISNTVKDPIEALRIYRNKDLIEKAFGDLKERLHLRRLAVSSEKSLDGKLFVEFIALIILAHVKQQMLQAELFKDYTMYELFDELDCIECFEQPGHALQVGEITKKQVGLYESLGVKPPTSLQ